VYIDFHLNWLIPSKNSVMLEFFDRFSKNLRILHFMKIRSIGAEFFREDRRTDGRTDGRTVGQTDGRSDRRTDGRTDGRTVGQTRLTKLVVVFHRFSNMSKERYNE